MGFNNQTDRWEWNDIWGKQYSTENFRFDKKFVELSTRKNVMDLNVCRLITSSILQRSMLNLTNRQAVLIADATFNRQGVVPGILEAYIFKGDSETLTRDNKCGLPELKAKYGESSLVDITHELTLEHERQMAYNGGHVNLFVKQMTR